MKVRLSLSDWHISAKVLLAPLAVVILLAGIVGLGTFALKEQKRYLGALTADVFEDYRQVAETLQKITAFNMDLYRLVSIAANDTDTEKLQRKAQSIMAGLDAATESAGKVRAVARQPDVLAAFGVQEGAQGGLGTPEEIQKSMSALFAAYREQAASAVDMVTVDTATATLFLVGADQEFDKLSALLNALEHQTKETTHLAARVATDKLDFATSVFLVIAAVAIALGLSMSILTGRAISRPVVKLTRSMEELAGGTVDTDIPYGQQKDEIGAMARALAVFRDNAAERIRLEAAQAEERKAKEQRAAKVESLIREFENAVMEILRTVASASTELNATAQSMSAIAEQADQQATATAAAATQASTNVATVATAAEQLSSSIQEIARQVTHSTGIAGEAARQAERTNETMASLSEAAQRIGEVVDLINDIAGQTNLLALNATIEAARAGEAGKGFAVVASEVKNLANQTARATEEIGQQVSAMQETVRGAVEAIQGISGTISDVNQVSATIASAVEEQGAATQEISRNVTQAAMGTEEVSSNIGGVSRAASETGAASGEVLKAARELAQQSEALKVQVERFLSGIRAA